MPEAENSPLVAIIVGSPSDMELAEKARKQLDELGIPSEIKVLSAHRTPDRTEKYVKAAAGRGIKVIIACAGMAAHLAGVAASHTLLPVIGVPVASGPLRGVDALLSTVQMPSGIPVATVAIGGARNAAVLAARILALAQPELAGRLAKMLEKDRNRYSEV